MNVGNISAIGSHSSPSYLPVRSPPAVSFQPDLSYLQSPSPQKRPSIASPVHSSSKFEYTVDVRMEDGSTVAERLLLDKEIAEVKGNSTTLACSPSAASTSG